MADDSIMLIESSPLNQSSSPSPSPETKESDPPKFVVLMETNGEECESWYYFIKFNGNEVALNHLQAQLKEIEMYIDDELSTFDLDLEHFVSERTAREMTRLELNSVTFHRKFNGAMKPVNIGLKKRDSNERRLKKINQVLGMQKIEDFVEDEEIDDENLSVRSSSDESTHDDDDDLIMPID